MTSRAVSLLAAATSLAWLSAGPIAAREAASATVPSLYARIGGYDFIAKFVDTAFPRVAGHPQLRRLFQGHSRDSQFRQRQLIVDALCSASGGPCVYVGRPMKSVHTGLGITADDWVVFAGILARALEELNVGAGERKEFLELLERRFRADVVESR
jgi:hemoglobin